MRPHTAAKVILGAWLAMSALLVGCPPPGGGPDAGPDSGADAGVDAGSDAGVDGGRARCGDAGSCVDASTLRGKLITGYQGWFTCPGDGSQFDGFIHWFRDLGAVVDAGASNVTVDLWPDVSELDPSELCPTPFTLPDGGPAFVFSSYRAPTVARHFRWMAEHHLDGVELQRFIAGKGDPRVVDLIDHVALNVKAGAEQYGRVFYVSYDTSGMRAATLVADIESDWMRLVDALHLTDSDRYLRHKGRPVVGVWGFGFIDRAGSPEDAIALFRWFQTDAPPKYRATVVAGVPSFWRTLRNDSQADAGWAAAYRAADVISPWSVGRFADERGADLFASQVTIPDLAETRDAGLDYLPVVFPGFSWHNLNGGPVNEISRDGGALLWRQIFVAVDAGAVMLKGAMFDEVDEGTAMFNIAPTRAQQPVQVPFVPLDVDGRSLPADWYLRVLDHGGRALRGAEPLTPQLPISP